MSETDNTQLQTMKLLEQCNLEAPTDQPLVYTPTRTPNSEPMGNLPLFAGISVFLIAAVCVIMSIDETQKDEKDRDGWMKSLVNYSAEKQQREGRAPANPNSYGPFSN